MKVVVGTDGSRGSLDALRWALDFCRARRDRHDELELVHVYSGHEVALPLFVPTSFSPPGTFLTDQPGPAAAYEAATVAHRGELQDHFRHEAEQLIADALQEVGGANGVRVTMSAVSGHPQGRTLVGHAADADLLVVGARGHASVFSHLLGSVSSHCVNNAACPVVVVRG